MPRQSRGNACNAMSSRVALVTCAEFPQLGEDEPLLLHSLRELGVDARGGGVG